MLRKQLNILTLVCCLCVCSVSAQLQTIEVESIVVSGNDKTRTNVILRELTFKKGDSIPSAAIDQVLQFSTESLLNTGLFNAVNLTLKPNPNSSNRVTILIVVRENWYLLPAPYVSLGDRNLTEWLEKNNGAFDRLNWGLTLYHLNATGRHDRLKLRYLTGLRNSFVFDYRFPYFGKRQRFRLTARVIHSTSNEVAYTNIGNEELVLEAKKDLPFRKFLSSAQLTFRPALYAKHHLTLSYRQYTISDSVLALNPYFFKDVNTSVQYFSLEYAFEGDYRDRRPVASEGYRFSLKLQKDGLGAYQQINQATLTLAYEQYFKISKHLTAILAPKARFHFTRDMNGYFFNNALSGDNLIRGYESYVIDGKDFIYANTGVRWNAFNTEINMGRLMPLKNMRQIPIAFFLGINCDAGIVFDPDFGSLNRFDNKILMGYGPFVQFLLYEHFLLSVEYNFNILQDGGMHIRSGVNF